MATKQLLKIPKESEVKKYNHIKIKGEPDIIYLSDLEMTTRGRIVNVSDSKHFTKDYQISFTSNAMFMTMLNNEIYKKFVCKIISEITNLPFDYLMENANYYKNEMNKDAYSSKGERGDLIIKLPDKYILIEMDMNNELFRNVEYGDRVYRINSQAGVEYIYPEVLTICFENFSFKGRSEDIMVFHQMTQTGIGLVPKINLLVFLPNLLKKWYHKDVNPKLEGFYKTVLTMYETSRKKAKEFAKGDEIMENYLEESKKVQNRDNGLLEAYDHEQSLIKGMYKQGIEEGIEQGIEKGIEQGKKETRIENAKAFLKNGADKDFIIKTLNLTEEEIKAIDEYN